MTRSLLVSGIALVLAGQHAEAQATNRPSPPARAHHTIFYDEAQQRILLTGGVTADSRRRYETHNDLWSFDGIAWTAYVPSGDRLSGVRVGVDARKRVHAFGGYRDSSFGYLRVLEDNRWRSLGVHPSIVVAEGGFVFDSARNRFVAFGGASGPREFVSDVWEYDGERWTKNPAPPPPLRFMHAMVYDARRKKTVVFGGMGARSGDQPPPIFGDTWEFDGTRWTQVLGAGPPPRLGAGAAYDSKRGLMLLFGGSNDRGVLNDLWSWDGASWKKLAENGPEPRLMGYIAYDKRRDRIVLFGGRKGSPEDTDLGDTWEWDGSAWRKIAQ